MPQTESHQKIRTMKVDMQVQGPHKCSYARSNRLDTLQTRATLE